MPPDKETWIEKILGVNWRTRLSGGIAFVFFVADYLLSKPEALSFMSAEVQKTITSVCTFVALIHTLIFMFQSKSANVTGGTTEVHYFRKRNLQSHRLGLSNSDPQIGYLVLFVRVAIIGALAFLVYLVI